MCLCGCILLLDIAEKIGQQCNYSDVFLPQYRLLPENKFVDALHDVVQAYEYLVTIRGVHPEDITLFGISSGGGLCVRLMQRIAEYRRIAAKDKDAKVNPLLELMPSGAVLMCPFVDYTIPPGSFREYTKHDLIVNDSVMEEGLPYFATQGDADFLRSNSPVYRPLDGLPPLCIVVSEHEACYDQIVLLCNNARAAGVEVDLGVWKYMCHVFSVLTFIPEAQDSVDFMCEWIKENSIK
jgi:acetyl esterase/lipase